MEIKLSRLQNVWLWLFNFQLRVKLSDRLNYQFRISNGVISYIIKNVCNAIVKYLDPLYLRVPSAEEEWILISEKFESRWQYPNATGAVDGKHVVTHKPNHGGSHYHNHKNIHSIFLMTLAGSNYEFLYADIWSNGRTSDGGVWNKCWFLKALEKNKLFLPSLKCLPAGEHPIQSILKFLPN